jgi:mRNA-degrading endonuclease RelE of RelBE toxin-antitoxin system
MSYKVKTIDFFERQAKRLIKKYPSLKKEIATLIDALEVEPIKGTPLGKNCYKVRLSVASKGKGKSGGARVITTVVVTEETVYLLSIYDKAERDSISENEINELLKHLML